MGIVKQLEAALAGACDQVTIEARESLVTPPANETERPESLVPPRPQPSQGTCPRAT